MRKTELIHTGGPYGDCTDNYDVVTSAKTVGEFITTALGDDDFQTFCIRIGSMLDKNNVCVAYAEKNKIKRKATQYDVYSYLKLKKITANGGWGNMTYDIWVEGEPPKQEWTEFQKIYWGKVITK